MPFTVVRRLIAVIPTLVIVSFAVFMLTTLMPGDPAVTLAGGPNATAERVAEVRAELRLDEPVFTRYVHWLGDAADFDFGNSLATRQGIGDEIGRRFPVTLSIVGAAAVVGLLIGVPSGAITGFRPGGAGDAGARVLANLSISIPNFLLGPALVVLLAVERSWLPPSGYIPFGHDRTDWLQRLVLPALTLGLFLAASLSRQLRSAVISTMNLNFVRTLWANGTPRRTILVRHVLRNAASPALTFFALSLGALLGGTVIVEQIFAIPGMGSYMLGAIVARDVPVIQAVTLVFVLSQLAISLLIDIGQALLNPKVRGAS